MRKLRKAAACISTRRRSADDHAAGTPTQPPPRTLHGNLAELYDRWAAGEVDEAFCTAAYGDAPLGRLLWWQWVERDRDICAHDPPRPEPAFRRRGGGGGGDARAAAAATAAAAASSRSPPTRALGELYDAWEAGRLPPARLRATSASWGFTAAARRDGLLWWQCVFCRPETARDARALSLSLALSLSRPRIPPSPPARGESRA